MSIVALISLWAEAAKVHLGNLTTRRLNGAVDLFKAVKTAVALWTEHSGEITGASSGEYFGKVAEIAVESSQKIQKLRNIVWMSAAEYKELVAATGTQIVLDLGQDSRMSENIADYTTGFIVRSVIGANRSSDYRLTQTDAQEFMTLIKGHIKLSEYDTLVKNFGSLSKLCDALGTGKLWNHKYFAADPKDAKKDDDPPKKVETISVSDHKRILADANLANTENGKATKKANVKLAKNHKKMEGECEKLRALYDAALVRIKELECENSELVKVMFDLKMEGQAEAEFFGNLSEATQIKLGELKDGTEGEAMELKNAVGMGVLR